VKLDEKDLPLIWDAAGKMPGGPTEANAQAALAAWLWLEARAGVEYQAVRKDHLAELYRRLNDLEKLRDQVFALRESAAAFLDRLEEKPSMQPDDAPEP
jgi:hypothetical protein